MTTSLPHTFFMQRCIELATNGAGHVAPNPMVGAVIVHQGRIIGEGWHGQFGGPHAEVNAFASVSSEDEKLLPESTLYVNLEPCSHHGKTPPCADLIVQKKLKQVVVANTDPNPLVAGKGLDKLRQAGIEVVTDILAAEGRWLNRRFFTFIENKRPYIILKWAQTADGFIGKKDGRQHWISGTAARTLVHRWRAEEAAIMLGSNTASMDNPSLTVRNWPDKNHPLRITIDKKLSLPVTHHLLDKEVPTLILNEVKNERSEHMEWLKIDFDTDFIPRLLNYLHEAGISSLIVEGGAALLHTFIQTGYWDEARIFTANSTMVEGLHAPQLKGKTLNKEKLGNDQLEVIARHS